MLPRLHGSLRFRLRLDNSPMGTEASAEETDFARCLRSPVYLRIKVSIQYESKVLNVKLLYCPYWNVLHVSRSGIFVKNFD